MTTLSIADIAALKAVTVVGGNLRFVISKEAFYYGDVASSQTPDDDNVVQPNSGVGRWLKATGRIPGLTYSVITGTQTVAAAANTFYGVESTNGIVTFTLPANPAAGDVIKIHHLSSSGSANLTRINRNGRPIRGNTTSAGLEVFQQYATITLTYRDNTVGWNWEGTISGVRIQGNAVTTFTYASDGDSNGLFEWLGRNSGTVTWANPNATNGGTGPKIIVYNAAGTSTAELTNRAAGNATSSAGTWTPAGYLIVINRDVSTREFRLTRLSVRHNNSTTPAIRNFAIRGLKSADFGGYSGGELTTVDLLGRFLHLPNWAQIARFENNTAMATTVSSWANYTVDASDFYTAFHIHNFAWLSDNSTTTMNLGEMEFYGEVRT